MPKKISPQIIVTSDGTGFDTKVVNSDGNEIKGIRALTIYVEAQSLNQVTLEVMGAKLDVVTNVDAVVMKCPICEFEHTHQCNETIGSI